MPTAKKRVAGRAGVVLGNVVGMRAEPSDGSEQVTQALVGQVVVAEGGQGDWLFVQTWDTYRGWIQSKALRMLASEERHYASSGPVAVIRELWTDVMAEPSEPAEIVTKVTIGVELEVVNSTGDWVKLQLPDGEAGFIRRHQAKLVDRDAARTIWLPYPAKLIETAKRFVGVPYLWGGTSPFGIDCSGFVQLVYKLHNVTLLRDASLQAGDARAVRVERNNLKAGDLVFFGKGKDPDVKSVTHVGLVMDKGRFIHSCGASGVTITSFNDPYYAERYWGARRLRLATLDPGGGAPED